MRYFIFSVIFSSFNINSLNAKNVITFSAPVENNKARIICEEKLVSAFKSLEYEINVKLMPAARALLMSNSGTTDGEVARIAGLQGDYPNLIQINEPCYGHNIYFYVKSGNQFSVNGWGSIPKSYLLGYRKGMKFIEMAALKYNLSVYPLDNLDQSVGLLMIDRINLIVGSNSVFKGLSKDIDVTKVIRLEPAVEWHEFFPYIHKKHQHLIPALTANLVEINKLKMPKNEAKIKI